MKIRFIFPTITFFLTTSNCWEYCQSDVQNQICKGRQSHLVCDGLIIDSNFQAKEFLAHVPLTRKVKTAFLNWHNYYRNRTAGGWAKNAKNTYFPRAVRMRELIWDSELSFISHVRTKLTNMGSAACVGSQRFSSVGRNLLVKNFNEPTPVLEVIALALRNMFDEKDKIENPEEMPKKFLNNYEVSKQFTIMVNDRVSRLGCAISLGSDCADLDGVTYKFCYYVACSYDFDFGGLIYKIGKPGGRCHRWNFGKSKLYSNLCANSGEIFGPDV